MSLYFERLARFVIGYIFHGAHSISCIILSIADIDTDDIGGDSDNYEEEVIEFLVKVEETILEEE